MQQKIEFSIAKSGFRLDKRNATYYLFKRFLHFSLDKIPRIFYHNQLLSTKFGRILGYGEMTSIIEQITEKTWGRGWVVLVVSTKWRNISLFFGELLAKNIARTPRRQLDGSTSVIWRIFSVLNSPLSPKLAYKQVTEDELSIDGGKHCFCTTSYFEWNRYWIRAFVSTEELLKYRQGCYPPKAISWYTALSSNC